jgi:protein O-mannosyl-transferase
MRRPAIIAAFLIIASVAAYWPVRHAQFINFDDPVYVTNNPKVFHGLTTVGVGWAFTTFHGSNWHPLTWLSHMLDCQVFGENAAGHHWVNVGFHAANAVLLFLLLRAMTGKDWRSVFVAALFALHPLHVESVAWVAERKDVLSTFFGLLTLLTYVRYVRQCKVPSSKSKVWYGLALVCFVLGLLSKPMLVTLPFLILLLDYWPLQRFNAPKVERCHGPASLQHSDTAISALVWEKLPFFALSAASSAVTFLAQHTGGAVVTMDKLSLPDRIANASLAYLGYLGKTFWPVKLAAYYPLAPGLFKVDAVLSMLALVGLTVLALAAARRAPFLAVGWLWFVGTLVPVIGLVQVGQQAMADRYTYFPLVGVFVIVAWGAADLSSRWRHRRVALCLGGAGVLIACFACTRAQVRYWQSSIALFSHAIQVTENNALAEHNLGDALSLQGNQREAMNHLDEALRIKPGYPQAHFNRGNAYGVLGEVDRAIADYREAIRNKPDYEQAYCNLGKGLALQGRLDEAKTNFLAALRCKPDYAEAHTKLGNVLMLQGKTGEALEHLHAAVRIQPDYDEGQYFLGAALARQKQFGEAAGCFRAAIKANPGHASALNDLGWLLATCPDAQVRNVPEAIRCAGRACELTGHADPMHLDTLAVAQSEAGQLGQAMVLTEKAIGEATAAGNSALAAQLQAHLSLYRGGRSFTQGGSALVPNSGR